MSAKSKRQQAFESALSRSPRGDITITRRNGKPDVTFTSGLTDFEALEGLKELNGNFAESLRDSLSRWGSLFDNQLQWVHKLVVDAASPAAQAIEVLNFDRISSLFDSAVDSGLKYPKIRFSLDGCEILLQRAGQRAKFPGSLNVTDGGPFGDNTWYGRIVDGKFQPSRSSTDQVVEFLERFSANPEDVAAEYGKNSGCCCFCNRQLTDDVSVELGYGPVCAKRYGLTREVAAAAV